MPSSEKFFINISVEMTIAMANTMMANLAIIMLDDQWNAHDPFVMHDEYDAKKSTIITTTMKGCYAILINGKHTLT